jgi:cation transport regulator ChaC
MKKDVHSYMFNNDNELQRIYNKIEELGYNGHSGASFGYIMRHMQFIAKNGIENHKQMFLQNSV